MKTTEDDTMSQHKYKVVSLFSGGMGLDIGIEQTNRFSTVACVEKVKSFCDTIRSNKKVGNLSKTLKVFEGDISDISPESVLESIGLKPGEVDLLIGGPPCQSFSTAGNRGTTQDPRGTLLWQFLKYIEVLQPRFFLMENVRGLLSAALRHRPIALRPNKGGPPLDEDELPGSVIRTFASDLQQSSGASYHMDCFEVNAVNYGAPQLRERALFIGNRFNAVVDFPNPTHGISTPSPPQRTLFDNDSPDTLKPWATLRDAISGIEDDDPTIMDFSPRKKNYLAMVPEGSNWRSLPEHIQRESMGKAWDAKGGRSGWWRRLSFDLPCPTLVTMPNHASTSLCHPTEVRALSLAEYAQIQEFPEDWVFCGKPSEKYAQVGNAVPIRLARLAGEVIAEQLDSLSKRDFTPHEEIPEAFRVIYIQSHVRTRQWFKNGEVCVWEDDVSGNQPMYAAPKTKRRSTNIVENGPHGS